MATTTTCPKRDLDAILAWLDAGLTLSTYDARGRERRFRRGDITRERKPNGSVRTAHKTADLMGYVWLTTAGIAQLAAHVRQHWGEMDARRQQTERARRHALDL